MMTPLMTHLVTPRTLVAILLVLAVTAAWVRLILWRRAAPKAARGAPWRLGLLLALQAVCATLLFCGLFPPGVKTTSGELVIATAGAPLSAVAAPGGRLIILPEAAPVAGAEIAPDLATALRRHPETLRLKVVGQGLTARDRDAVQGFGLAFDPTPPPKGLIGLSPPSRVAPGADFQAGGQVAGLADAVIDLVDPAGRVTDTAKPDADGRFVVSGTARSAGAATFVIRVRAGGRTVEQADLPVLVEQDVAPRVLILAGAPGPEVKYLRRWATDAGFAVTTQASAGGGIALADPPVAITTESLRRFDIAVIDDRSWDGLGGGRGAVLAAVRDGLGLVLRSGGALDETGRSQWRALGFGVSGGSEMAPIALPPAPDAAAEVAMARTRRGIPAADAPADLDGDDAFLPEISRLALALGGEGTVPSVRDAGGAALSAWRASGRGRIAVFTGIDSFGLSLTGRSDLYGDWWGRIFSSVARPAAGAAPAFEGQAWVGDRVSLCSLAGEPRIERPTGAVTQLQVDAAAGTCAGFWPSEAGWHLLRTRAPDQAEQVWPFFVYPAEGLAAVRATRDRDATLMLRREAQAAGPTPGPDAPGRSWPWLAAWLIFSGGLWWLERSSRGRAVPQPH